MVDNLGDLVNAQVDINRAVWAGNAHSFPNDKTKAEREVYIIKCAQDAIKSLNEYLVKTQNLLF